MIQNYFGEETIWKLLANNPYEKNNAQGITLHYRASTFKENHSIVNSFLDNIPGRYIIEVEDEKPPVRWGCKYKDFTIIKRIVVRNVFGNESEVNIRNM